MKKFEFSNYKIEVDIAGKVFALDCSTVTGDYLLDVSKELRELSSSAKNNKVSSEDIIAFGKRAIDHLLGEGSTDKIFEGRTILSDDVLDIIIFLTQTQSEFQRERHQAMMNRAQRRAKK